MKFRFMDVWNVVWTNPAGMINAFFLTCRVRGVWSNFGHKYIKKIGEVRVFLGNIKFGEVSIEKSLFSPKHGIKKKKSQANLFPSFFFLVSLFRSITFIFYLYFCSLLWIRIHRYSKSKKKKKRS